MKQLIKRLLDIVRRALAVDPRNTAEIARLRGEVTTLTGEKQELESLTGEINEVIDSAAATTPEEDIPPAEGRANVSFGFISDNVAAGGEYFSVAAVNRNVTPERAALLKSVIQGSIDAGNAQAAGGSSFPSSVYFVDASGRIEGTFNNGKQKAAADVAGIEPLLEAAKAQRDAE